LAALWNPAPVDRIARQHVAFDDRYGSVEVGQQPRGEQPAHTGAEYHGVVTEFGHRQPVCLHRRGLLSSIRVESPALCD